MKYFQWDIEKNLRLKIERGLSFEDIVYYIEEGRILDIIQHPDQKKHGGQKMYILNIDGYVYIVPFVESDTEVFLKTIIPSRKATRKYLKDINNENSKNSFR